ncbi:MAG: cytochrome P460 family protein, partial [Chitinophagales bacterium]|nr:cytochrome P460 family protein [Chitinophagales bacterium]
GLILSQCKKATPEDEVQYNKAVNTTGFTYYQNSNSYLPSSSASGHGEPYFRVRFNQIAYTALTDSGRLPTGSVFPEGSIVVKELYDNSNGALKLIAIMEKTASNSLAANGWLWSEYKADGKLVVSVNDKGTACTGCHSTNSRDYARLFDLF